MASQTPEHSKPGLICCLFRCAFVGSDGVGKTSILYRLFRSKAPPIEDFLNVSDDQAPRGRYGMPSLCDICDHQTLNMELDGKKYALYLRDTSDEASRLRPLAYSNVSIVVICFSIADVNSFHAIESYWLEEINHFHPRGIPKIIIGNKIDLRTRRRASEEEETEKKNKKQQQQQQQQQQKKKKKNKNKKQLPQLSFRRSDPPLPAHESQSVSREEGMRLAETINAVAYVECSAVTEEGVSDVFRAIQNVGV
ncbi:predicted protein [Histoplasma capsulatum var. duboisii H88]|uniref:Predicted protein n=1 Tax=Ajellomyces capsulatus (strain H88) TaxID=544711 RepID=F0U583_AJEC8|nr:predicted protein [Histoplasma capsulatum var. duboisii H88]